MSEETGRRKRKREVDSDDDDWLDEMHEMHSHQNKKYNAKEVMKTINKEWLTKTCDTLKKHIEENTRLRSVDEIDPVILLESETNIHLLLIELQRVADTLSLSLYDSLINNIGDDLLELLKYPKSQIIDDVNLLFELILDPRHYFRFDIKGKRYNFVDLYDIDDVREVIKLEDGVDEDDGKVVLRFIIENDLFGKMLESIGEGESSSSSFIDSSDILLGVISKAFQIRSDDIKKYVLENSSIISRLRSGILEDDGRYEDKFYITTLFQIGAFDPKRFLELYPEIVDELCKVLQTIGTKPIRAYKDKRIEFFKELTKLLILLLNQPEGVEIFDADGKGFKFLFEYILKGQTSENFKIFNKLMNLLLTTTKVERNLKYVRIIMISKKLLSVIMRLFTHLSFEKPDVLEYIKLLTNFYKLTSIGSIERKRLTKSFTDNFFFKLGAITSVERKYSKSLWYNFRYDNRYMRNKAKGLDVVQEIIMLKSYIFLDIVKDEVLRDKFVGSKEFNLDRAKICLESLEFELKDDLRLKVNEEEEVRNKLTTVQELLDALFLYK